MILRPLKTNPDDDVNTAYRKSNFVEKAKQSKKKEYNLNKDLITLTQMVKRKANVNEPENSESEIENEEKTLKGSSSSSSEEEEAPQVTRGKKKNTNIFISAYEGGTKQKISLLKLLHETTPKYVILYDIQLWFVRQLEIYKALHFQKPMRIYVLMYLNSSEEQRYLTSVRSEKESFEILIKQKAVYAFKIYL